MVPPLIGIARLAAGSLSLETKRRVEYKALPVRSYLARCDSERLPFRWTINPYRGCEFGCKYCYARYTHEFMELHQSEDFETQIFAKQFNPELFRRELRRLPVGESIALGTATDPYQPAERRYGVTRQMLEVFARIQGLRLGITTKSDLVRRDLDLLVEVARRHYLSIHMTVTTVDADLARLIEPLAPRPELRFDAVRHLSRAGLRVVISCAPVMPLINDGQAAFDALAKAAREAGAAGIWANVLFLKPCASRVFLPFVLQQFPHLFRRYEERYGQSAYLRGSYPDMVRERMAKSRRLHGFPEQAAPPEPELWPNEAQMKMF